MEALLTIVLSQRALFDWRRHDADAGYALLTFETSMTMLTPNSRIVVKRYVILYQQTTTFTLFEASVKYRTFCVKALRYNKTNRDLRFNYY